MFSLFKAIITDYLSAPALIVTIAYDIYKQINRGLLFSIVGWSAINLHIRRMGGKIG